jgi:hypothetical protein
MTRRLRRPWRNTSLTEAHAYFEDPMEFDEVQRLLTSGHATKQELRLCGTIKELTRAMREMLTTNSELHNELVAAHQKIAQYGSEFAKLSEVVGRTSEEEEPANAH